MSRPVPRLSSLFDRGAFTMNLSTRFAIAVTVAMALSGLIAGTVVNRVITQSAISNAAAATAIVMDGLLLPIAREMEETKTLPINPSEALRDLLSRGALGGRIHSIKLWRPDGVVAYSHDPSLIGRKFPLFDALERSLRGELVAEIEELDHEESAYERRLGVPLLEVYTPIRDPWTGRVLGVAEFYENASGLRETLRQATLLVIAITIGATLLIGTTLFGIVHQASRTIERQRHDLRARTDEAERVSEVNRELRLRVQRAASRGLALNERHVRQLSADLHDGPAQLIGFAALRISSLKDVPPAWEAECTTIKQTLDEAMREIRAICSGMSLPEIGGLDLGAVIRKAAQAHERRTDTRVSIEIGEIDGFVAPSMKYCAYRFVQEGLNNAYRHAEGRDQSIECGTRDGELFILLRNGPAVCPCLDEDKRPLGLIGLRERVEVLGGTFGFSARQDAPVEMWMALPFGTGELDD
ncbi:sensor histidine kinase [Aquibium carbonis]|uniref:Sensor histidine kinase n=1 Tax=Aquibium carbonis TaxID=2495581 RepID=A0A3S0A6U1_9HYPH|nr:histidine kinase [Aquibium carbonis]RST86067.1 sensor histidine kinase [Aquibium carbonis]